MSDSLPATITYCSRCGAEVSSGARYCGNCGQAVALAAAVTPTYTVPPPPRPSTMVFPDSDGGIGKLFSASGRIGRLEYFLTIVGIWILIGIAWVAFIAAGGIGVLLALVLFGAGWFISLFAGIKRLHDFDQNGWLILLSFVPIAGFILGLFLLFKGPSAGLNRFGYTGSGSPFGG